MSDAESDNGLGDDLLAFMDGAGDQDEKDNVSEKQEDGENEQVEAPKSPSPPPVVATSPSPPPPPQSQPQTQPAPAPDGGKTPPRRGVAQKLSRKGAAARRRARQEIDFESEDEGEASDKSANTIGSGAMSESDSEEEATADNTTSDVLFPYENKFYDADDKRQIMGMPEIQREAILAERALQVERHGQKAELRRLFQNRAQEESKASEKRKRKAAVDLDDGSRKSSRAKTKASDTLEEYKRQREQRSKGGLGAGRRLSGSSGDDQSEVDADGEDEVEWDTGYKSSAPTTSPLGSLKSFNRVRISRSNFAQCCFWPDFEESIRGCYSRLLTRSEGGQQVYRMVRIKGFTEGRPYEMEWNNKRFMTDQYMICAYGKETQEKEFVCASESTITDQEFDRYKRICEAHSVKLPTEAELSDAIGGINKMLSRKWTDEDINAKIARQNKYQDRVRAKMSAINANKEAERAAAGPTQSERLAALNAANRKANSEAVRKAQIAENKKRLEGIDRRRKAAAEAKAVAVAEAAKVKDEGFDDLFDDVKSRSATPGSDTPGEKKKLVIATPRSNGIAGFKTLKTKTAEEEAFEQMDLGIDIEI